MLFQVMGSIQQHSLCVVFTLVQAFPLWKVLLLLKGSQAVFLPVSSLIRFELRTTSWMS